jgi:hypothetical protein
LNEYYSSLGLKLSPPPAAEDGDGPAWQELVSQGKKRARGWPGKVKEPQLEPTTWRIKIFESSAQAPEGWTELGFDDSSWWEGTLPLNWRDNHAIVCRAPFEITDPAAVKALQFNQFAKHMDHMRVYINGKLVARVSAVAGGRTVSIPLNDVALKALKKGKNVLAVTYQHHLRWGSYRGPHEGGLNVTLEMLRK